MNRAYVGQRGAGFIEVLVALVVLSIGLLGVVSMQTRGLGSNQRALFATDATILAYDMADRIEAFGQNGAVNGEYNNIAVNAGTLAVCAVAACTIVESDQNEWISFLRDSKLPGVRGDVVWDPDSEVYTITIRWDQERKGDLPANNSIAVDCSGASSADPSVTLTCFQLQVSL